MTQEKKNMGFFTRVLISIKDFEKYQIFASEKISVAIKYFLTIMLIFVAIVCLTYTYKFAVSINKGVDYFKQNITQLQYTNGELQINSGNPINIQNEDEIIEKVIIDTGASEDKTKEYIEEVSKNGNAIIFLKDKIVFKNEILADNIEYKYEDIANSYSIGDFNKEDVLSFIANLNMSSIYSVFFITMLIYLFIIYTTSTLIDVLMLAVLGFVIARIAGMKIRFKATYNMAIYALTLPIILNLIYVIINTFTGITVQYFNWMYTTISYIYMIIAILMIKTDLINKQMELMRIVEEQEKVREELKRKQEEKEKENKEKEKENKEKEKENKEKEPKEEKKEKQDKKEKKNKDNNLGDNDLAPQNIVNNERT